MNQLFSLIDRALHPFRRLGYYITRILPGLSRLFQASAPAQAAIIVFLFLLIVTIIVVVMQWVEFGGWGGVWPKLAWLVPLDVIIPPFLYFGWLLVSMPGKSPHPDIDDAWQVGVEAIQQARLPIRSLPLFLVIGGGDSERVKSLMAAAPHDWLVDGVTAGYGPLIWYANKRAIFLCCQELGCLAAITKLTEGTGNRFAAPQRELQLPDGGAGNQDEDGGQAPGFKPPPGLVSNVKRTIDLEHFLGAKASGDRGAARGGPAPVNANLSLGQQRQQRERFEYALSLLRLLRAPVCPMNGMMAILPFHTVLAADRDLEVCLQQDFEAASGILEMRCSCFALVTDMEHEPGFLDFVRRVGEQAAAGYRFGISFELLSPPVKEELLAFGQHVCGMYEDWTFQLFNQKGALDSPTNGQLFALMCKIRGRFRQIFTGTLPNGFGCETPQVESHAPMFSGCYYAAGGPKYPSRAFIREIFSKFTEHQDDLEWMPTALARDDRRRIFGNLALLGSILTLVLFLISQWN